MIDECLDLFRSDGDDGGDDDDDDGVGGVDDGGSFKKSNLLGRQQLVVNILLPGHFKSENISNDFAGVSPYFGPMLWLGNTTLKIRCDKIRHAKCL